MLRAFIAICLALTLGSAVASAQSIPAPSTWKNQRGSEMTIKSVDPANVFTGEFVNNAPDFECRGTPGFDVKGSLINGRLVFAVVWKNATRNCNSITAWRGRLQGNTMNTTWILVYADRNGRVQTRTGRDTFQRAD